MRACTRALRFGFDDYFFQLLRGPDMTKPTPYTAQGFADRRAYLDDVAKQFKREPVAVHELAALLGQAEDFRLLPITLRDFEEQRAN